uniref:uncharacterized protein LOC109958994 isoform X2 n=1 Tax=Monopterus albus TaxID=43700 RepID=UPI0009B3F856|nr:uncharacterized protein LOC109958994 isoform X2 [Monopterus albus]
MFACYTVVLFYCFYMKKKSCFYWTFEVFLRFAMSSKSVKVIKLQRREDSGCCHHCCVPMCTASARFNSVMSFHVFPKDKELQKRWLANIRRNNLTINKQTRVCSRHFKSTDLIESPTSARQLKNGAVPVLFQWNNFTPPVSQADGDQNDDPPMDVEHNDHNYCSTAEPTALTDRLCAQIERLRGQIEKRVVGNKFGLERFSASDDDIRFYTRFATYAHLMAFWRQIEPAANKIVWLTRAAKTAVPHPGSATSMQPIDEFFLFMTYLSMGLMQNDLAHRFGIHPSRVSSIITTWADFLYTVLGAVGIWMSEEAVKAQLPDVFKNCSDTQVVLNCIELRCLTSDSLLHQNALYTGSMSDKEILKQSGILSLISPTTAIMVDKGFLFEDCVPCKVYTHAFLSNPAQLPVPEVREAPSLVRLRVHVEQLIQRVKDHKIFSTVIPMSFSGSINQLYTVACILVNYQNGPLVKHNI